MQNYDVGGKAKKEDDDIKKKFLGLLFTVFSATGFGLMAVFAKIAFLNGVNVTTLLGMRFIIASILMWGIVLIIKENPRIGLKKILKIMTLGGICYGLESALLFKSIQMLPAAIASILFFHIP